MRLSIFLNLRFSPVVQKLNCKNMFPRLGNKYLSNPAEFCNLYSMVNVEVEAKKADGSSSCSNGLLWLTRAMDFIVESFRKLMEHEDLAMSQVRSEAYTKTLKKYHGWLASSTFSVAMKLAPDRKKFMAVVGGTDDIKSDIEKFTPLLQENHKFLGIFDRFTFHWINWSHKVTCYDVSDFVILYQNEGQGLRTRESFASCFCDSIFIGVRVFERKIYNFKECCLWLKGYLG